MSSVEGSTVMHRITILVVVAMVTSLTAATTLARAAGAPEQDWAKIDDTFTWSGCGFAIEEHDVATLRFVTWLDESGNRTRQIVAAPGGKITWTNAVTRKSVTTANTYVVHKTFNADGSVTLAFTGISFAIQGGGRVYVDSGRMLAVFADGSFRPISSVGPDDDLCEALTAAIG
jgi:hypothetical protein